MKHHTGEDLIQFTEAGKYLKPYQGLKRCQGLDFATRRVDAGKYLKPYQGLKHRLVRRYQRTRYLAGKYLKPYQGLKLNISCRLSSPFFAGKYLFPHLGLETPKLLKTGDRHNPNN